MTPQDNPRQVFRLNTQRVQKLIALVHSDDALKPKELFGHEGPGADVLRAAIVFLHAAFEVFLRSLPGADKKMTVNSWSDIKKSLIREKVEVGPFEPLRPLLTAFLLIPGLADQNPCAQSRRPMDMTVQGCATSLFQA